MIRWKSYAGMVVGLAASALVACTANAGDEVDASAAAASEASVDPALLVEEPRTLGELETRGLSLASVLGVPGTSARDLFASPKYKRIVDTIDHDLRLLRV